MTYLDANVFIYAAAIDPLSGAKTVESQRILRKVVEGHAKASTSLLTWDEAVWVCREALPYQEAILKGNLILNLPGLNIAEVTVAIVNKAVELATTYSLKPRDAIHAATAILNGEKEIITDDADFDKVKELRRVSLAEASR